MNHIINNWPTGNPNPIKQHSQNLLSAGDSVVKTAAITEKNHFKIITKTHMNRVQSFMGFLGPIFWSENFFSNCHNYFRSVRVQSRASWAPFLVTSIPPKSSFHQNIYSFITCSLTLFVCYFKVLFPSVGCSLCRAKRNNNRGSLRKHEHEKKTRPWRCAQFKLQKCFLSFVATGEICVSCVFPCMTVEQWWLVKYTVAGGGDTKSWSLLLIFESSASQTFYLVTLPFG